MAGKVKNAWNSTIKSSPSSSTSTSSSYQYKTQTGQPYTVNVISTPKEKFEAAKNTVQPATPTGAFTALLTGGTIANPYTGRQTTVSTPPQVIQTQNDMKTKMTSTAVPNYWNLLFGPLAGPPVTYVNPQSNSQPTNSWIPQYPTSGSVTFTNPLTQPIGGGIGGVTGTPPVTYNPGSSESESTGLFGGLKSSIGTLGIGLAVGLVIALLLSRR